MTRTSGRDPGSSAARSSHVTGSRSQTEGNAQTMISTLCVPIVIAFCLHQADSVSILQDDFLLLTDSAAGAIYQLSRDGDRLVKLELNMSSQVPVAVDFDPEDKRVYWTDLSGHSIRTSHLNGSDNKILVQLTSKSSPEGVAVDPVAGLLFYTDQGQDVISILKTDGTNRKILIRGLKNPRSIRLDTRKRQVYWADWGSNTIERADYDGSNRRVLYATDQSWINGLALDLKHRHIYWVDAYSDLVQRADMDGGANLTVILDGNDTAAEGYSETVNPHFYGIALDDDFIYMTDWDRKGVFSVRKNGSDYKLLHQSFLVASGMLSYRSSMYIFGHPSHCNDRTNPNAGCSNLCIPTSDSVVCACPDTMKLADDGKHCDAGVVAVGPDVIWLEHDTFSTSYIMGMHGEPAIYLGERKFGERWSIRSPLWHWTSVDNDYRRNKLYMADREDNLIVQLSMTTNLTIDVIHFGTSSRVNGIAVDWLGRNVYWTDSLFNWIMMAKATKNARITRTLVSSGLEEPHGIAVWPEKSLLLWTDWGSVDKIESSTLSGAERRILVETNLNNPTGITIDYKGERVYWCNRDSIEEMKADGSGRRLIGIYPSAHFMGLAHYDKFIFATDKNTLAASYKLWILNTANPEALYPRLLLQRPPYGITMLSKSRQENFTSVCDNYSCSQLCVMTAEQRAECLCGDGFDLQEDGKSCAENSQTFVGPSIIYSLGDRLCSVSTQEAMGFVKNPDLNCFFVDKRYSFRALDYHYSTGNIYFSEVSYRVRSIRMAHMKNITDNMAIVQGTGDVYGIAVDYSAGNLYWTDTTHGQIWVSRLDGTLQKILLSGLLHPMGIAIDQREKKLYWSDQGSDKDDEHVMPGSLKKANLDGTDVTTLRIEDVHKPAGISFDPVSRKLFWVDQAKRTIEYIRPDGLKDHGSVQLPDGDSSEKQLYDIAIFQDFYAYTEWDSTNASGVRVMESESGNEVKSNLLHHLHGNAYDVIVFSKQYQAELYPGNHTASCVFDNGGCEQLCLQKPNGRTCACVDGMVPNRTNERRCTPSTIREDNFFLIADDYRHQLYQLGTDLEADKISAVTTPLSDRPIAVAYDFTYQKIYWTDFKEGVIKRSFLNGSQTETVFIGGVGSRIDGLAFDHESRILYYTDTGRGYIGILNPPGTYHKIIVREGLANPRAIVLDTKMGYMYYTVRNTSNGRIERRDLTGKNPVVLVGTSLSWPNGLDIDFEEGRLYWVDAHSETIESCALDGSDRKVVYSDTRESDPFGLAVQGSYVYWTDWTYQGVFRVNKNAASGANVSTYYADIFRGLNDIKFFNRSALRGANVCSYNKADCSHFCLSGPDNARICECPDGYKLHTDDVTCVDVPTCPQKIPNGEIDVACTRELGETCSYVCNNGYEKTRSSKLKCDVDMEWNANLDTLCAYDVCPLLVNPAHATADASCPLVAVPGISCTHVCDYGFVQVGGDMRRNCTVEKKWTGEDIICIPVVHCPPLTLPEGTVVYPQSCGFRESVPGQVCEQKCRTGYRMNGDYDAGSQFHVCLGNSSWNGTDLQCVKAFTVANSTSVEVSRKSAMTTPILIGVVVACLCLVLVIIFASILLIRKRNKRVARYRDTTNIPRQSITASESSFSLGKEVNGNTPAYNARTDSVDLDGKLLSFSNPVYGAEGRRESATDASPFARQESLSSSSLGSDGSVGVTHFDNPLYVKDKLDKEMTKNLQQSLEGKRVQPDLTRELSTA